jgi:hypothetical protein
MIGSKRTSNTVCATYKTRSEDFSRGTPSSKTPPVSSLLQPLIYLGDDDGAFESRRTGVHRGSASAICCLFHRLRSYPSRAMRWPESS